MKLVYDNGIFLEIFEGLREGLDVSRYTAPLIDAKQIWEIRIGLKKGLQVAVYSNPGYAHRQMQEIRYDLEDDLVLSAKSIKG